MEPAADEQYIRRNYWLGVANGALVITGAKFLHSQAIVAVFLVGLGASPVLVGLASSAVFAGFFLVPLVMAPFIERAERKKPFYFASTAGRFVFLGALTGSVLLLRDASPWLVGGVVVALLFAYRAAIAIGVLAFYDIVAHSVPARRRGTFFARRRVYGDVFALAAPFVAAYLLDEAVTGLAFPRNYATIFAAALVLCGFGATAFCFVKEPRLPVDRRGMGTLAKLREGWAVSRRDRRYMRLILCRLAATMRAVASPFYVVYCLAVLGAPGHEGKALVFLFAHTATRLVTNPLWARLSDGQGNAKVLRLAYAMGVGAPVLALVLPWLPSRAIGPASWGVTPQWIGAVGLYVVYWAGHCGGQLGGLNYMLEIAPEERRPSYIALGNVYTAPVLLCAPLLGGWLADTQGYWLNFALAAVFAVVAAAAALGLHEPRERPAPTAGG